MANLDTGTTTYNYDPNGNLGDVTAPNRVKHGYTYDARNRLTNLGFEKTTEVPDGDKLGFLILQKGGVELMYQTFASQEKDIPGWSKQFRGPTFLYIEVDSLDAVTTAMKGVHAEVPERTTFYGAREIGYKNPGGHIVLFAEYKSAPKP